MSKRQFRHQDIAEVPRGWKVRTKREGSHEIRIAFPPGRRKKGDGKLISILHPLKENPCRMRNSFDTPQARAAFAAGIRAGSEGATLRRKTKKRGRRNPMKNSFDTPLARAAFAAGIRAGSEGATLRRKTKKRGRRNPMKNSFDTPLARAAFAAGIRAGSEGATLRRKTKKRGRRNPDDPSIDKAKALYQKFHGRPSSEIVEMHDKAEGRTDYTALGDLLELVAITPGQDDLHPHLSQVVSKLREQGESWTKIGARMDMSLIEIPFKNTILAADPAGSQLYVMGNGQKLSDEEVGKLKGLGIDTEKDMLDLGELLAATYRARKFQTRFSEANWEHILGEENESRPVLAYDKVRGRFYVVGGNYRIERPGIIN